MTEEISALVDDEISESKRRKLLTQLCHDKTLQKQWESYHLIRSAIRGECMCLKFFENIRHSRVYEPLQVTNNIPNSHSRLNSTWSFSLSGTSIRNWLGGIGLGIGVSAATAFGFISFDDNNWNFLPATTSVRTAVVHSESNENRWVATDDSQKINANLEQYLNHTLLAHSETSGYLLMNGLSSYIRLVSYNQ